MKTLSHWSLKINQDVVGSIHQTWLTLVSKMCFKDSVSDCLKQQHVEYILSHVRRSDPAQSRCVLGSDAFVQECFLSHTIFCRALQINSDRIVTLSKDDEQMRTESPNVTFSHQERKDKNAVRHALQCTDPVFFKI